MNPAQQAAALLAKADDDCHVLAVLCNDVGTTDAIWGFHAQQAAEKLLKGLLSFYGFAFPFTHRLLQLADVLADAGHPIDPRFEPLLDLTPYAVELRYGVLPRNSSEPPLDRAAILELLKSFRLTVAATADVTT